MSNTPATAASSSSKPKAAGTSQAPEKRRPLFRKELQRMMYGFGDEQNRLGIEFLQRLGIELVEDIVVEYVTDLTHKAQEIGTNRGRLLVDDFLYQIRKATKEVTQAKKLYDFDE